MKQRRSGVCSRCGQWCDAYALEKLCQRCFERGRADIVRRARVQPRPSRPTFGLPTRRIAEPAPQEQATVGREQEDATHTMLKAVCGHFGISLADLTGRRRPENIAHARQVAMYVLRYGLPGKRRLTNADIGRLLGGRDHSTVSHGCEVIRRHIDRQTPLGCLADSLARRERSGDVLLQRPVSPDVPIPHGPALPSQWRQCARCYRATPRTKSPNNRWCRACWRAYARTYDDAKRSPEELERVAQRRELVKRHRLYGAKRIGPPIPPGWRQCSVCFHAGPRATDFHKGAVCCKPCARDKARSHYHSHKEDARQYRRAHAEHIRAYHHDYYRRNSDKINAYSRAYRQIHIEKVRERKRRKGKEEARQRASTSAPDA